MQCINLLKKLKLDNVNTDCIRSAPIDDVNNVQSYSSKIRNNVNKMVKEEAKKKCKEAPAYLNIAANCIQYYISNEIASSKVGFTINASK